MDDSQKYLEHNIERLIQVGLDLPLKLDPQMKERTWQRMISQLDVKQKHLRFPDSALVILTCTLAGMAVWIMKRMLSVGLATTVMPPFELVHIVLTLNLLCVPVAGIVVIVARRRYVE